MNRYVPLLLVGGVIAVGGYLVYSATSTSDECSGSWTDNFNPACWAAGAASETNTVLLIVGAFIVLIIALLAFGPQTGHIAGAASRFAVL